MALTDMPLFEALKGKMQWHQARQNILAENVANAETPGYRGRDLADFKFGEMVDASRSLATVRTNARHIATGNAGNGAFGGHAMSNVEITPEGNGVVLENEMMKVTENQMDYQAATSLYTRSMRMLKTALGKGGA